MSLRPLLERLSDRRRLGARPGLGRIQRALSALGDPHRCYETVHIAGTNGKGSVAAMIASALRSAGYHTGLFTSPHLIRFAERIQVGGRPIDDAALEDLVARVLDLDEELTFFEVTTAVALTHFAQSAVEIAVLEVGLGGRLDATNVVRPQVSVITTLDRDHSEVLGFDLAEIAAEKAGIIKPEVPVVAARAAPEVEAVLRDRCAQLKATLALQGSDFDCHPVSLSGDQEAGRGEGTGAGEAIVYESRKEKIGPFTLPLAGLHQRGNAAVALAAVEALQHRGFPSPAEARVMGMETVCWPGRMEWVGSCLLDCAHNPSAARALAAALAPRGDFVLVFGALEGKDFVQMLKRLAPHIARAIFTRVDSDRAVSPATLVDAAGGGETTEDLRDALDRARGDGRPVLVTGSAYLVGEARRLLLGQRPESIPLDDPGGGKTSASDAASPVAHHP